MAIITAIRELLKCRTPEELEKARAAVLKVLGDNADYSPAGVTAWFASEISKAEPLLTEYPYAPML